MKPSSLPGVAVAALLLLSSPAVLDAKNVHRPHGLDKQDLEELRPPTALFSFFNRPVVEFTRPAQHLEDTSEKHPPGCHKVHHAKDKCAFIREFCEEESVGIFNYLELYYCRLGHARGFAFLIMTAWLSVLFSTIGIAASDFFCVNLSTIASVLGMSESLAGVTFLAFGNGSPDVFSTFSAMKINAGSLAVGELIGAASFITAVVAGSMAIVRPFKVGRRSFVRDVCFFAAAVLFSLIFLADGKIRMWECVLMIVFYIFYVIFVVGWHWWTTKRKARRRKERRARSHHVTPEEEDLLLDDEDDEDAGVGGNENDTTLDRGHDFDALERAQLDDDEDDMEDVEQRKYEEFSSVIRDRPGIDRRLTTKKTHGIRSSLVGALEFRAVLNSLGSSTNYGRVIHMRRYSDDPMVGTQSHSAPGSPRVPFPGMEQENLHIHTPQSLLHPNQAGPSGRVRAVSVNDAQRAQLNPQYLIPLESTGHSSSDVSDEEDNGPTRRPIVQTEPIPEPANSYFETPRDPGAPKSPIPRLLINDDDVGVLDDDNATFALSPSSGVSPRTSRRSSTASPPPPLHIPRSSLDSSSTIPSATGEPWKTFRFWPYHILPPPQELFSVLFPTLCNFYEKSIIEKILAIASVPSVFLLTITLPVVDSPATSSTSGAANDNTPQIVLAPESPSSFITVSTPGSVPVSAFSDTPKPLSLPPPAVPSSSPTWTRWLVAVQCVLAPVFIATILTIEDLTLKPILYALLVGLICLFILLSTTNPSTPPRLQFLLCFAGFIVAISWISTIAEEVVGVLKAFGVIFNISDAILGLTIFAVGNSLGDLVADITVARLGFPVMALSACFGGPMLNILLGVGGSGLYMTGKSGGQPYKIEVSSTLLISAATLLLTLCVLLVWVPMNRWMMDRRIGVVLVAIWAVSTVVNVVVEIAGVGKNWA